MRSKPLQSASVAWTKWLEYNSRFPAEALPRPHERARFALECLELGASGPSQSPKASIKAWDEYKCIVRMPRQNMTPLEHQLGCFGSQTKSLSLSCTGELSISIGSIASHSANVCNITLRMAPLKRVRADFCRVVNRSNLAMVSCTTYEANQAQLYSNGTHLQNTVLAENRFQLDQRQGHHCAFEAQAITVFYTI